MHQRQNNLGKNWQRHQQIYSASTFYVQKKNQRKSALMTAEPATDDISQMASMPQPSLLLPQPSLTIEDIGAEWKNYCFFLMAFLRSSTAEDDPFSPCLPNFLLPNVVYLLHTIHNKNRVHMHNESLGYS